MWERKGEGVERMEGKLNGNHLCLDDTSPFLTHTHSGSTYPKLSYGTVFTMCSHTFTLFWLRKTSVIVKIFQLSFRVLMCAFHPKISSFFSVRVFYSFLSYFCFTVLGTFLSTSYRLQLFQFLWNGEHPFRLTQISPIFNIFAEILTYVDSAEGKHKVIESSDFFTVLPVFITDRCCYHPSYITAKNKSKFNRSKLTTDKEKYNCYCKYDFVLIRNFNNLVTHINVRKATLVFSAI